MIIRQTFPFWYTDAAIGGGYAGLIPDQAIDSSRGRLSLPGENPLFTVCGIYQGVLCVAGKGGSDKSPGIGWLHNGAWHPATPGTYGNSPLAFGPLGLYAAVTPELIKVIDPITLAPVADIAKAVGSRGIGYVDPSGRVWSVDECYGGGDLAESVPLGTDLFVGQAWDDGCQINYKGTKYLLEPGDVEFIRAHRAGDDLAVAIWKAKEGRAVCFWLTVADIVTLPPVARPAPVPAPVPVPVPVPPKPEPVPVSLKTVPMPARVPVIVQALYGLHTDLAKGDDDQRRELMRLIGEQLAFELGPKFGCKDAGGGRPTSKDAIGYLDGETLYAADCFNGETRKPAVPNELTESPGQHFESMQPINHLGAPVGGGTAPAPGTTPATSIGQSFDLLVSSLQQQIGALTAEIATLRAQLLDLGVLAGSRSQPTGTGVADGSVVALKSHDTGEYITVEPDGLLNANGPRAFGDWQLFTLEVQR